MEFTKFEWDEFKNTINQAKHGVSFDEAQNAFYDVDRIITEDLVHSHYEERFFCFGMVDNMVMTVRFTYREHTVRIFGAGYWRIGRKAYEEQKNKRIH